MGLENVRDMVDNYKAEYGIEMYINLDHSQLSKTANEQLMPIWIIHIDVSQKPCAPGRNYCQN